MLKFLTRREFFKFFKISLIFLLSGCFRFSKKLTFGCQKEFIPSTIRKSFSENFIQQNINFSKIDNEKNNLQYVNSDLILINDGWINSINFGDFKNLDTNLNERLDKRSKEYLYSLEINKRKKLFPAGLVPYAVIVKNNKYLKINNQLSWDFLLRNELKGNIILPNSSRLIISLAQRMKVNDSLKKFLDQENIYDDKNILDWIMSKNSAVAIIPYNQCQKILKIDSRISIVFPNDGVPLSWFFALIKNDINEAFFIKWINSLDNHIVSRKLAREGWFLPFSSLHAQSNFINSEDAKRNKRPSEICWKNSWSFPPMNSKFKEQLELYWNKNLTP